MSNKKVEMKVSKGGDNDIDNSIEEVQDTESAAMSQGDSNEPVMGMTLKEHLNLRRNQFVDKMTLNNIISSIEDYAANGQDRLVFSAKIREDLIEQLEDMELIVEKTNDPTTGIELTIIKW